MKMNGIEPGRNTSQALKTKTKGGMAGIYEGDGDSS